MAKVKKMKCPKIKASDFKFLTEKNEGYLDEDEDPDGEQNESNYCDRLDVWRPLRDFYSSIKVGDLVTAPSLIGWDGRPPTLLCTSSELDGEYTEEELQWEYVLTLEFTDTVRGNKVTITFGTYDSCSWNDSGFQSSVVIENAQGKVLHQTNVPLTLKLF